MRVKGSIKPDVVDVTVFEPIPGKAEVKIRERGVIGKSKDTDPGVNRRLDEIPLAPLGMTASLCVRVVIGFHKLSPFRRCFRSPAGGETRKKQLSETIYYICHYSRKGHWCQLKILVTRGVFHKKSG